MRAITWRPSSPNTWWWTTSLVHFTLDIAKFGDSIKLAKKNNNIKFQF